MGRIFSNRYFRLGTSMVEMLAVLSVILILLGTYAANTIRTKNQGDLASVRMQAATLDTAVKQFQAAGPARVAQWGTVSTTEARYGLLIPFLSREVPYSTFIKAFEGYTLTLPNTLPGTVTVTGPDGQQVYPALPTY